MADNYLLGDYTAPEENKALGTTGDFAKTLGVGALNVGSNLAASGRFLAEGAEHRDAADLARGIQMMFQGASEGVEGTINPETRKLAASSLTSKEFWEHPVLGTALKTTGMLPSVAAIAIPGGLLADATAATIFAAGAGGVLNAGDGVDQFYKTLDAMDDAKLQEESPKYRAMREMMDEAPARARFNREAQGWGPALNVIFGAASGAIGPAGIAARGLAGGAKNTVLGATEAGAVRRAGLAAAEGAVTNAAQEGVADVTVQNAEMEADLRRELDMAQTANRALEGGALGGVLGGAVGAVAAPKRPRSSALPKDIQDAVASTDTPDPQMKDGTTGVAAKPVEYEANPQNAPAVTPRDKGKGDVKTKPPRTPTEVGPVKVDPGVAAAVAMNEGTTPVAAPNEVAAMTTRTPNATIDAIDAAERGVPQEVTPPALDTGMNVPEAPQSIPEQIKQIGTGERKAVMLPPGTVVPADALGGRTDLKRLKNGRGVFIYDPKLTNVAEIQKLSKVGRENELLGLGPVSKPAAVADAAAGATPVAITERTPAGTEVKAAAGTTTTLPEQVASLEVQKTPGNVVAVEAPETVAAKRNAQGGRVLPNLATTAETTPLSDMTYTEPKAPGEGPGKNYRGKAGIARNEKIAKAKNIVDRNAPDVEFERGYLQSPKIRDKVIERAQRMVAEAKEAKLTIQAQLKKSAKGDATSDDPAIQILRLAKDLDKVASKHKEGAARTEATKAFAEAERLIRAGHSDEVLATRREEGDARFKKNVAGEQVAAGVKYSEEAPQAEISAVDAEAKPDVTSVSKDDVVTAPAASAKMGVRGIGAGTEKVKVGGEEVERAKAAATRVLSAEEKAAIAAKMGLTVVKGKPERAPTKAKPKTTEKEFKQIVEAIRKDEAKEAAVPDEHLTATQLAKRRASEEIRKQLETGEDAAAAWLAANDRPAAKEALRVDRNPSDAQIAAGNYKKGHRRVEGLPFTIETPAGATRRGVGEDGTKWSVKMPAGVDYGYFRGTKGADGEHIDGYDLRTGNRNFVVDQLDTRTGEFDEHKVFTRAKDEQHVVDTYRKSFSDGRADERLGNLHEVTREELHDWMDAPQTESITKTMLDRDMGNVNFDVPEGPGRTRTAIDGTEFTPIKSATAAQMLAEMDLSQLPGIHGVVSRFTQSMLSKLAKDVEVHLVSEADMKNLSGINALGLHIHDGIGQSKSEVFISVAAKPTGAEVGTRTHALLHELVHAVTAREIDNVPGASAQITKLMEKAYLHAIDIGIVNDIARGKTNLRYGFTNPKEFMAEALSNRDFQNFLATVPLDRKTSEHLGIRPKGRQATAWDMVRHYVKKAIEKVTGTLPQFDSALDGILRIGDVITSAHKQQYLLPREQARTAQHAVQKDALRMVDEAVQAVRNYVARPENNTAEAGAKALRWRTFDNIAQLADAFFPGSNPVRKIHNAIEKTRVRAERLFEASEPIVRKLAELRAANPEKFAEFASLQHDATVANVHPDVPLSDKRNAHLGKKRIVGNAVWAKAQHAKLAKRFAALPEEYKQAWHEAGKFYTDRQDQMSLGIMNNQVLKLLGVKDAALAQRIHEGNLTDADRTLLGDNADVIEEAGELSKIDGYYVPLMRRGDHVVRADYKVTPPGNGKKLADNEFEFTTAKEAEDYAAASPLSATIKKVWIDPKTGERLGADELDSVDRYRVTVQNRHVEFVEGRRAAAARAAELAQDAGLTVHEVVPRSFEPNTRQGAELSTALGRLVKKLEHSDAYKAASPTERAALKRAIEEAALASHGSTRISSRALPRRAVQGFSEDSVSNTVDYAQSSARYIAKLEHATELEAGLKEMQEALNVDHSKGGLYARTAISNEVRQRVEGDNGFEQGGKMAPTVKRLLSASFTDKLGSPAYSIINSLQPAMITMPYMMARYGVGRSFAALGKAYADINAGAILKEGGKGTARQVAMKGGAGDLMSLVKRNLSANEKAMLDAHMEVGTIDKSAGLEVSDLAKSYTGVGGKTDAVLGYLEGVTREMPRAVEMINRSVTALAVYRSEIAKGVGHDKAVLASRDAVNNTQFNYSPTNAPPLFNHPLLKIALQFKKYGQGMYQLIGTQVGRAMRNQSPGDRAEAVKTLIGIAGTHMAMAGALGLPTEPFKYLLMGASAAGLPVGTWSDVEDKIRRQAAVMFGKTGGEVFTRGLPRLINLDLSRMGLDSVTSFGEPKSKKDSDVKTWLFDSLSGPVVSLGGDYVKGAQLLANGDFGQAAEKMIPLKAASDSLRAYRQATEGKKNVQGQQTSAPYSPTEAGLRALGFGSGREAEEGARKGAFYRASVAQKEERSSLVNEWTSAKPAEKMKAWAAIQKWNKTQPAEVQIKFAELTNKAKRDAKAAEQSMLGIKPNKRDKRFLEEGAYYNTR